MGFQFKQPADYDLIETPTLYHHLYAAQEGQSKNGIRFAWYPTESTQALKRKVENPVATRTVRAIGAQRVGVRPKSMTSGTTGNGRISTPQAIINAETIARLTLETSTADHMAIDTPAHVGSDEPNTFIGMSFFDVDVSNNH